MRISSDDRALPPQKARKRRSKKKQRKKNKRLGLFGLIRRGCYWCLIGGIWGVIFVSCYVGYVALKMPQASTWSIPIRPPNIRILDRNGILIANRGLSRGESIPLKAMSPWIAKAVVAIEDQRFYQHFGVDPIGILRAIVCNLIAHQSMQGGSTLTQQLAKNLFLSPERTIERKVQEALLALWLERHYSKDQILELYLNRVYLGSGTFGVEAASRRYFNKSARDLNIMEAATLAGLLKAPSRLSPARDPKAARKRAKLVVYAMREQGMISQSEMSLALKQPIRKAEPFWSGSENYVADEVVNELLYLIGEVDQDIVVETTIDLSLEEAGEKAISNQIKAYGKKRRVSQGALIAIDKTGAVRALIGGVNYSESQYNRAIEAKRQPGSTFKTFVYLTALEAGMTPNTIKTDAPIRIGEWTPRNFGGKYFGDVTLTTALSHSLNSVAAQLIMEVGVPKVIAMAHRLGIHSGLTDDASIALGTSEVSLMELTGAFVPLANGGFRPQTRIITRVKDIKNNVLYDFGPVERERVLAPNIVAMLNAMLEKTVEDGTAKHANIGRPTAGKTGTSQNFRDAWFIGYTADYITGVWFGNDDGQPMKSVTGGGLPVLAWRDFMVKAEQSMPVSPLPDAYVIENAIPGGSDEVPMEDDANSPYKSPNNLQDEGYWTATPPQVDKVPKQTEHKTLLDIIRGL